jgi:hypothetical protein
LDRTKFRPEEKELIVSPSLRILVLAVAMLPGCTVSKESGSSAATSTPPTSAARQNSNDRRSPANGSILVDFENGTVGGENLRQGGESLERHLGPGRVYKTTEVLEGRPIDVYVVRFGDHEVCRHWNAFSYKDPIFRTKEGLGIDSSIAEFETIYGKGEILEKEGCSINFQTHAPVGHFAIICPQNSDGNNNFQTSPATEIWVW